MAYNVHGFGLVWYFPTVRPVPQLIFCLDEVKNKCPKLFVQPGTTARLCKNAEV
jgi:hypothetical protein